MASNFDEAFEVRIGVAELAANIPDLDARKRFLAKDPLASVDGFRALVLLTCTFLFGMRVCENCPACNFTGFRQDPCQDYSGSNATPEGCIFGRVDAGYTSVEAQKPTGALHAHSQLFVQCIHPRAPLHEVFKIIEERRPHLVEQFCQYKAHVSRQVYAYPEKVCSELEDLGGAWPEYAGYANLIQRPAYRTQTLASNDDVVVDGKRWARTFLKEDVETLQMQKQHHVHLRNENTGEREPLGACRRQGNPKLCKSNFPRPLWLIDRVVVLCKR